MDDEEEDMSRPISQHWGTPFMDVKYEDRATQIAAGQAPAGTTAASRSHDNNNSGVNALPCGLLRQPHVPFHGNAGLRSHFPAQFEPMEDRGGRRVRVEEGEGRGQDDHRAAPRPEEQAGLSVEVQIGRKLREIGDRFQQDHLELVVRHQRDNLPLWMRLTMAVFGFLFPREVFIPRLRGEQR
ncbi:bcl-2-modifying factor isoform X2 [Betta splendens]|nr:bcl-2-modifying factor isoform X2 [Betta splendens]XP_028997292.1 bcl-2-modifying factor isoform X2 [Betta splendens]